MLDKPVYMMVVTPHADDAEFGVAGTAASLVREGKEVVYVVCTNGDKGSSDFAANAAALVRIREEEQRAAAKMLGVREVVFLRYPDQGLEDSHEFRKELVRLIRVYRPEVVATTDPYRRYIWHRDHRIAGQVVLDAVFPYARDHLAYPDLWEQGLQPHKVRQVLLWGSEEPNHCYDITDTFDIKVAALRCHASQIGEAPAMEGWLRERARKLADGQPYELAESFRRVEIRR